MPYNQKLAERVRTEMMGYPGCVEKKLFGGVGFMLRGNMACGVQGDDLIVRVGSENNEAALAKPHVQPFMPVRGKPMAGWVVVAAEVVETSQELKYWIEMGTACALSLPAKE